MIATSERETTKITIIIALELRYSNKTYGCYMRDMGSLGETKSATVWSENSVSVMFKWEIKSGEGG